MGGRRAALHRTRPCTSRICVGRWLGSGVAGREGAPGERISLHVGFPGVLPRVPPPLSPAAASRGTILLSRCVSCPNAEPFNSTTSRRAAYRSARLLYSALVSPLLLSSSAQTPHLLLPLPGAHCFRKSSSCCFLLTCSTTVMKPGGSCGCTLCRPLTAGRAGVLLRRQSPWPEEASNVPCCPRFGPWWEAHGTVVACWLG